MTEAQKRANSKHLKENYKRKTVAIRKETAEKLEKVLLKKNISFNKMMHHFITLILAKEEAEEKQKQETAEAPTQKK